MTGDTAGDWSGPHALQRGSTDSAAVARYYDDWAGAYEADLAAWDYAAPEDCAERLVPHLTEDPRILDVGCGSGLMAETLARRGVSRMYGIDISTELLEIARRRGRYAALTAHDLQRLPLPAETDAYDAAICIGVMTYIAEPEALLREMARAVRPGGVIAFTQRSDRWEETGLPGRLARLEAEGVLETLQVSEPRPYLPGNPDFGEAIGVRHVLCRAR